MNARRAWLMVALAVVCAALWAPVAAGDRAEETYDKILESNVSTRGSADAQYVLAARLDRFDRLPEADKQRAIAAARTLMDHCPYTRAGVELTAFLRIALRGHLETLDADAHPRLAERLAQLESAQALQWAMLERLQLIDPVLSSAKSSDMARIEETLDRVLEGVRKLSAEEADAIFSARIEAEALTFGDWPMKAALIGAQADLMSLETGGHEALARDSAKLVALLDTFIALYC